MVGAEVVLGEGASTRSMIETGRLVGGGRVGRGVVVETGSVKLVIVGVVVGGGRCRLCCIVRAGGGGGSGQLRREGEEGVGWWLVG